MRKFITIIFFGLFILSNSKTIACEGMHQDEYGRWVNCAGGNLYGDSRYNMDADPRYNMDADPRYNMDADPNYSLDGDPRYQN